MVCCEWQVRREEIVRKASQLCEPKSCMLVAFAFPAGEFPDELLESLPFMFRQFGELHTKCIAFPPAHLYATKTQWRMSVAEVDG